MPLLLLIISTALLTLASVRLGRATTSGDGLERALAALLLLPACVVVVTMVVGGLLAEYRPVPLTLGAAVVAAAMLLLAQRAAVRGTVVLAVLEPDAEAAGWNLVARVALAVLTGVVALALASRAMLALVLPPNAFDALAYHVPAIAEWVRSGQVAPTDVTRALCCPWYPSSGEAWAGWSAPFLETSRLIGLGQLWFAVVLALSAAVIARCWGASQQGWTLAAVLAAGMPIVLAQSDTAYVDLTFAACLLAGYAFTLVGARRAEIGTVGILGPTVLAGVAIGLALGTKGTGLVAAPLCAAVLVVLLVRRLGGQAWRPIGAAAVAAIALGTPWYVSSWIETGNPITPYELEVGGTTVFEGTVSYDHLTPPPEQIADLPEPARTMRSWAEDLRVATPGFKYVVDQRAGGFGPAFLLLGLPGLLWLLIARRHREAAVLLVPLSVAALLFVQPYPWWSRFTIVLGALGMVAGARLVERLPRAARAGVLVLLVPLVALPAMKVAAGDSVVVARHSRGEIVRSAPTWLRDRPSAASLFPRFAPLDTVRSPVLVDKRVANRTVGVLLEGHMKRRVHVAVITAENLEEEIERAGARTVVLPRALAESLGTAVTLAKPGRLASRTDELYILELRPPKLELQLVRAVRGPQSSTLVGTSELDGARFLAQSI